MSDDSTQKLIYKLCNKFIGNHTNKTSIIYDTSLALLDVDEKDNCVLDETDEFYVLEKIKKPLMAQNKQNEALRFEEIYYDLKSSGRVKKPVSLMIFFYTLCQSKDKSFDKLNLLRNKFLLPNSVPFPGLFKEKNLPLTNNQEINLIRKPEGQNQLLKSYMDSFSAFNTQYTNPNLNSNHLKNYDEENFPKFLRKQPVVHPRPHTICFDKANREEKIFATNLDLFRELLLAFQGYSGKILEQNIGNDGQYQINSKYKVDTSTKSLVLRLSNLGWMFHKINKYCDHITKNESIGHVSKSFVYALQNELNSYLKLVTMIEQQYHFSITNNCIDQKDSMHHSFLRLQVMTFDSFNCLKSLASLIDNCKDKRGGSLINTVYKNIKQGDPMLRNMITKLLTSILIPLRKFLSNWLFYGELDDPYKEFFISCSRNSCISPSALFWHEKYKLNEKMLPNFISVEQAKKVLATGKAINVLKQISESKKISVNYFEELKSSFEGSSIEELFNESFSYNKSYFQKLLTLAYKETNQNVLKILYEDYNFKHHLEALKLFLLLGQGDFIRYLMDLLEPILEKPAKQCKNHKTSNCLNNAIRSTNAQYLIEDVIDRLDIRFLDKSTDETGWDIFTLIYHTKGPISIVFTNQCMENYSILFKYLWRSKRMEFILNNLLQKLVIYTRNTKNMPELKSVFHLSSIILTEMVHFIKQMQYYLKFEVLECSWVILEKKINEAEDIDQLIKAQEEFLATVTYRTMLDNQSRILSTQLRAIYDTIIDFQNIQNDLYGCIECEVERRSQFSLLNQKNEKDKKLFIDEFSKQNIFKTTTLPNIKVKIQSLSKTYENMVQKFLVLLAEHNESDLRCLSVRLDFNEYYKKRNKSLESSFTYKFIK